ncbi:MAG: HlyD family efflux transporter periplasmic adaptor subunit [Bacteroidetes bacterium]|nr:HlyD family efflux transporter periplasmic adaptor subunit [Bacteroidota bacterium]
MIRRSGILKLLPVLFLLSGCGAGEDPVEKELRPKVPVTVESIHAADVSDYLELTATSSFLTKSLIKSPVSAYVEEISVNPGDAATRNQVLFKLRTKESTALQHDSLNPYSFSGLITIKANIDGIILTVDHPRGDYLQEGEQLATIAVPSSFVFLLDVPYENIPLIKISSSCEIVLPDGHSIRGTIQSRLPSMTPGAQTQRFIIRPAENRNLPENLIANIRIVKKIIPHATLLSKSCILADEVMKNFWVMKLVNDSMAVKVPVITGLTSGDDVEITTPVFSATDRFLNSGNFGLGDTAIVSVVKTVK